MQLFIASFHLAGAGAKITEKALLSTAFCNCTTLWSKSSYSTGISREFIPGIYFAEGPNPS
jgi:hypothetical protein